MSAVLLPATVTKLRSNKTQAKVWAEGTRLIAEADDTSRKFDTIKEYGDQAAAVVQRSVFNDAIGKLDLSPKISWFCLAFWPDCWRVAAGIP